MKHALTILALSSVLLFAGTSKIDEKTGLIWQDSSEVGEKVLSHEESLHYCHDLKVDGFSDWRLPTLKEAYTIVDLTVNRPALKKGFDVHDDGRYWTSTRFAKDPQKEAWYISMSYGEAEAYKRSRIYHVRCVRNISQ